MDIQERDNVKRRYNRDIWAARAAFVVTRYWGPLISGTLLLAALSGSGVGEVLLNLVLSAGVGYVWWRFDRQPRQPRQNDPAATWPPLAASCGLGDYDTAEGALSRGAIATATWVDVLLRQRTLMQVRRWATARAAARLGERTRDWPVAGSVVNHGGDSTSWWVEVQMLPGQIYDNYVKAVPAVAAAGGVSLVRMARVGPSTVRVRFVRHDALATPRRSNGPSESWSPQPVVVGRDDEGRDLAVDLRDPWHVAIQGMTRSGKSVATYTLLGGMARQSGVVVCGVDPSGLLLGPWATDGDGRFALGTADPARYLTVASEIVAEMDRRIATLGRTDAIREFGPNGTPVLLAVFEEYPGILRTLSSYDAGQKPADRIGARFSALVERLVAEGAKAGVRVVLLAQRFDASIIGGANRSNFGLRISLRVDADGFRMLHPDSDLASEASGFQPGYAVISRPGHGDTLSRFDLTEYGDYLDWLSNPVNPPHGFGADGPRENPAASPTGEAS